MLYGLQFNVGNGDRMSNDLYKAFEFSMAVCTVIMCVVLLCWAFCM